MANVNSFSTFGYEKITLTREEFKKRFEDEFRVFKRYMKEIGKYKFVMTYLFSHKNKTKEDLFNAVCIKRTAVLGNTESGILMHRFPA